MNTAQQKQLYSQIKNLSDEQLADLLQQNDPHKSPMALGEINYRNDVREAKAMQMDKPPTVAEQQLAKAGIGAPPIDPSMISPQMAQGVGNPAMMPSPQPIGSGVGQLEAPMMAAGGGLVALAEGGLPEDYVPFSERSGLQRFGGFFAGDDSNILGDIGYGVRDAASDPTNYLAAIPAAGVGLKYTAKGLRLALDKAKKLGLDKKAMEQIRSLYRNPYREFKNPTKAQQKQLDQMFPQLKEIVPKGSVKVMQPGGKGDLSLGRAAVTGTGLSYGAKGIGALMGDDAAATPAKQRELMGPPKPSDDLIAANQKAAELQERLKAAQDAAAKAGENVQPEGRGRSFLSSLATAPEIAGIVAGLTTAEEGLAKGAAAGIKTLQGQQEQELKREQLENLKEYRDKTTELQEKQMKLVYDAAIAKTGLTKAQALKEEREFKDDLRANAKAQAMQELKEINKGFLPFGIGGKDTTIDDINARTEQILDEMWMKTIVSGDLRSLLSRVTQEKTNRLSS